MKAIATNARRWCVWHVLKQNGTLPLFGEGMGGGSHLEFPVKAAALTEPRRPCWSGQSIVLFSTGPETTKIPLFPREVDH